MREVNLVGTDAGSLVLQTGDGEKLSLPIDEALRSAVRSAPIDSTKQLITPREIQDAVRAGATISEIVSSSGANEDFVTKFAIPVIEELEHMLNSALAVRVETGFDRFNEMQHALFGEIITERLKTAGASRISWQAHRESPTTWLVIASYSMDSNEGTASWSFDPRKYTLSPEDTNAIALSNNQGFGDRPIPRATNLHPASAPREVEPAEETTLLDAFRARREANATIEPVATEEVVLEVVETVEVVEDSVAPEEEPQPKKGRAPMPSWDEIVFGSKSEDQL